MTEITSLPDVLTGIPAAQRQQINEDVQLAFSMDGFQANETEMPKLSEWDIILLNSSGGKDSQTMIRKVVRLAVDEGYPLENIIVAHAELGRVEWEGTTELAREQSEAYGLEFRSISRPQGDLLDHIEKRGMFPGPATRYCTSDHKRSQIAKVITRLDRERREGKTFSVLNCMGLRAQESSARRKKSPFTPNKYFSTKTRTVWDWLPILHWTEDEVWTDIKESGIRYHDAYNYGMPRLSCVFCIYAPKGALVLAAKHNPKLLSEYVEVEKRIGHKFRLDVSMADVQIEAESNNPIEIPTGNWNM